MEDITVEVTDIEELFFRFNLHRYAPIKRKAVFCGVVCLLAAAVPVGLEMFSGGVAETAVWGIIFGLFSLTFFILSLFCAPRAVKRMMKKKIRFPIRSVYRFGQQGFTVESYYPDEFKRMDLEYSEIKRVWFLDEKTVFLQLGDRTFCSVSGKKCGSIVALLSSKLPRQCFI